MVLRWDYAMNVPMSISQSNRCQTGNALYDRLVTLPFPYEVEQNELEPRKDAAPARIDIEALLGRLVVADDPYVDVGGCRLRSPTGRDASTVADEFRRAIVTRFLERRPNADEATWTRFASAVEAALAEATEADRSALAQVLRLVDGL